MTVAQVERPAEAAGVESRIECVQTYARSEERSTYGESLSRLGAFLDARGASHVSVREEGDFAVTYWTAQEGRCSTRVAHPDELAVGGPLDAPSRRRSFPFRRRVAVESARAPRYERALRALGQELDGLRASRLLIDETEEGFLVIYSCVKASRGVLVRKRLVFLHPDSVNRVLAERAQIGDELRWQLAG